MTNIRLTDPEVLKRRFSVRVRRFHIRRGSGAHVDVQPGDVLRIESPGGGGFGAHPKRFTSPNYEFARRGAETQRRC